MIKTKDEILSALNITLGENASDEALGLIEDISDTFNDFDSRLADSTDWKSQYEENDAKWRQKYKERFFTSDGNPEPEPEPEPVIKTFEDLFKIGG